MPSTASESLGEIEVPKSMSETAQRQRVAQIERTWRDQQPTIEGEKVLLAGYETHILDASREVQSMHQFPHHQSRLPSRDRAHVTAKDNSTSGRRHEPSHRFPDDTFPGKSERFRSPPL